MLLTHCVKAINGSVMWEVDFNLNDQGSIPYETIMDWVLSHWAHFTVHRCISVCVCVFCRFF